MANVVALTSEMIGRSSSTATSVVKWPVRPTVDRTKPDYIYNDKARRGKAIGLELASRFIEPAARIMSSWALGSGVTVTDGKNDTTNKALAEFIKDNLSLFMQWDYDSKTLGDGYVVVNPDGSVVLVSPDQVTIETDPLDYRKVVAVTVTSQFDQPLSLMDIAQNTVSPAQITWGTTGELITIYDRYTETERTVTIKRAGKPDDVTRYSNLIGRIPVMHLPNQPGANETNGHSILDSQLYLMKRYDAVLNNALDAVELMGHPVPVAEGLDDPESSRLANSTTNRTVTYADGTQGTEQIVDFSAMTMMWLGKGASFKFAAPGSFTGDTMNMVNVLFWLLLQNWQIPEGVWGGAITGSRASLDAQMPSFVRTVEGWQKTLAPYLAALCEIWLAYRSLVDPAIRQREKLLVEFAPVLPKDDAILLQKINTAADKGWITDESGLRLLDLVEDPAQEVEVAQAESDEKQQRFNDQMQADIEKQAAMNDQPAEAANAQAS